MLTAIGIAFCAMILGQVYVLLLEPRMILDWLAQLTERMHPRLAKLLTCSTCMAGQIALWAYLMAEDYHWAAHVMCVALAIWLTHATNRHFYE